MKKFQFLILITVLAMFNSLAYASEKNSGVYAITFHADWCGSCKKLEPMMTKARGKADLDNQTILFVTAKSVVANYFLSKTTRKYS